MKKYLLTYFALVFALSVWAQDRTVTGKVTSAEDGSALPGVNVLVKGTTNGTTTAVDGAYTLSVPENSTLIFSFIGLKTQESVVGTRTTVDVALATDMTQLAEVVVTGVGVATDKRRLAISVESISGDKLPQLPAASIDQALVGKIAGAQIFSTSGNPGAPVSIQLRGINTLSSGTQPLILVDGVEMRSTSLNSLDLSNVEKIEVVQGASAATIYGAQGANGVIQIFTKRGKQGPMKIEFSARTSTDKLLNIGDVHQPRKHSFVSDANGFILDSKGGGKHLKQDEIGVWAIPTWDYSASALNNHNYNDSTKYYDHVGQLFNTASTHNYNLSLSGGKEKSDYAFSFSKMIQESIIQGKLDRNNITANIGAEILPNLKLRYITQLVYTESTVNPNNPGISSSMYTYPFADFNYIGSDGHRLYKFGTGAGANSSNPLYAFEFQRYKSSTVDVMPSLNLHYDLSKVFAFDYKAGANVSFSNFGRTTDNQTQTNGYLSEGKYSLVYPEGAFEKRQTTAYNVNSLATATAIVDFDKTLGLGVPITSTTQVAYDWRRSKFNRISSDFVGLPIYASSNDVNGAVASSKTSNEYEDEFITYGYLVNQRIEYKEMLGVSGGFRTDYSSVYGESKKPFTFPRADAYFRLSKMGFWQPISSFLPEFKLRAAYGEAGIQPSYYTTDYDIVNNTLGAGPMPNHYPRITTYNSGIVDNGSVISLTPVVSNAGLKVESSKELELGVDFGVAPSSGGNWFNNISGSFSVWRRRGYDLMWQRPLATSTGSEKIWDNYVDVKSQGTQFSLDFDIYSGSDLTWDMTTNFGNSKSWVTRIADHRDIPLPWVSGATYVLKEGSQIGSVNGYKALTQIDQKDPAGNYYLDQNDASNYEIVDGRVVDKTSKMVKFTSDKYALGNTTPKFQMNFINSFAYKNYLTFSFQVDWVYGAKMYNQTKEWMYSEGLHGDYDKSVTINGESGPWVAYYKSFYDASESNGTKDYFLENASFARLRNVSVGVDFAKLFDLKKLTRLQLVLSGRNLYTITNYTGFDPESNQNTSSDGTGSAAGQTATQRGLDYFSFPNFRSYQVGLNISFN